MKVPRTPVRGLEAETSFAEIDFAREAALDHPLQCPINSGAANAALIAADEIKKVICTEMTFLTQEYVEDMVAFAGALATSGKCRSWR